MFWLLIRLAFSVLLAITPIVNSAVSAFSIEQPAPSLETLTSLQLTASTVSGQSNVTRLPASDLPSRPFEIQRPSSVVLRPDSRPLAAGTPQTITVQVVPNTLIANSAATAIITATVVDLTGTPVSDVNLTGVISPTVYGTVSGLGLTNGLGQITGTWQAGTQIGLGTLEIGDGVISGTASINIVAGAPFTVTLQADPTNLPVGASSALTATVVDQYNNTVLDGTSVTFATDRGSVLTPRSTTNGVVTSTISSTLAGTAHITATSDTAFGIASAVFTPGTPFTVTLQANPTNLPVGTSSALTATVVDQYNNTVLDGTSVTFATDRGSVLTPRSTTNGVATSTISSTLAGTAHITATSDTAFGIASAVFTPGTPFTVTLLANPASLIVGSSSALTATVVDQYNNTVLDGTSVTFATDRGNVLTPRSTTNGVATSTISSTLAGTAHITATSDTAFGIASAVFTPGTPFTVTLQANPTNLPVGTSSALTATVVDQYNNTVLDGTSVTFATDRGNVLTPRSTINGLATSTISSTLVGTAHITATSGGRSGFASVVFNPDVPFTVTLQANPTNLPVGTSSALTATVVDQYNNTVLDGTSVTFATDRGNVLTPRSTTNGVATSTISSTLAGTAHITATSDTAFGIASAVFTPGTPFTVTLQANPTNLPVGTSSALTATVVDQYNNTVLDGTSVTFATDRGNVLTPRSTINGLATSTISSTLVGTAHITATSGGRSGFASVVFNPDVPFTVTLQANPTNLPVGTSSALTATVVDQYNNTVLDGTSVTFATDRGSVLTPRSTTNGVATSTISSTLAGTAHITATSGGRSGFASVVFNPGAPFTVTLLANPASLIVGSSSALTAMVVDQYNNTVLDGTSVTFATDRGSVLTPRSTTNGLATSTISSTLAGTAHITATSGGRSGFASVVFNPGAPFTVTLLANPASLIVGSSSALTATVVDQYNNTVTNGTSVTFATDRGSVLTPRSTINGVATSTISSTLAGTAHITATSGGRSGFASVVFNPGAPFTVTLLANPASLIVGSSSALTATVVDQYNNTVTNGTSVTFATDRGSVLTPRSTTNGLVTSTISSTLAGTAHITATSGGRSGFASVVFNPGAPFTVTLLANPASLIVGSSSALTATVVDQYNNTVTNGTSVTFATDRGSVLTPRSTTNGVATSTISSTLAGTAHITATSGGRSGFASVVFNPGAPFTVTLLANPASLIVGSSSALTATVVDQYNNTVTNGTSVTFATDRGSVLTPRSTTNGLVTSTISSTLAGTAHITATSGGRSGFASVVFNPGAPFTVTLLANPASLTVGTSSALTATVVDRYNNTVLNGTSVTFATDRGSVLTPRSTINGLATSTISSTLAGTAHITATSGGRSGFASVVFNPGAPYTLTLQPPTAVINAGVKITYTAIATDSFGNLIGNVTGGTTFSIALASGGVFTANAVTPTVKNTWIITGVNGAASRTATLTVTAATFNRLAIENAPAGSGSAVNAITLTVYDTLPVYAAAYDVYNNLIGPRTVTWGGTGVVAGRLSPTSGQSTTFTPVISGTGIISATSSGITDTTGLITVQAPALQIRKSADPNPITPGAQLHYTIVYTNGGNAAAQNVIITETYPLSTTNPLAFPPPSSGNNIWSIGSLGVGVTGTIDVYVTVAGQMPVGSVLTNTVRMGAAKVITSAVYTRTTQVNAQPDFKVDIIDSSDPVRAGETFFYTIQYRNDGTAPVTGVRITETYPSQVTFLSANPPPNVGNNVWLTNTLNRGESRLILVTVRVNRPIANEIIMNNQVTIDSNETAPFATTEQTLVIAPEVYLTKVADPLTPTAHSELTYTLHYTNTGSSYAANATITDALPANTSFERCEPIGCTVNNGIVTWNIGDVPQQSSDLVTLTVNVANNLPAGTRITNTARLTSTDLISATTIVTSTIASAPDLVVTNTNSVTALAAGEVTTYVLGYANLGTAPTQNVVITDRIPDNTTFVDCTACTPSGSGVYSFTLGTVNAAQSSAVTVSVRVASILPAGLRFITNTAHIATTTNGDASANNTADDVDAIVTQPALDLSVDYDASTPYPGKVITYTLRYTNSSAMDTTSVVISTTRVPYVNVVPTGWSFSAGDDLYSVGNLAAGQAGTINYVIVLTATFTPDMNAFANNFLIHDGGPGGLPTASQNVTTTVGVPDLIIESVKVPGTIARNQQFTATLTIRNIGLGRACNPNLPGCGQTWVDAFVDPVTPPSSYPFSGYGDPFARTPQIDPGLTATVYITNIQFGANQDFFLYFKVDNFDCHGSTCLPPGSLGGLVPESNEYNNLTGPIHLSSFTVYLPLVTKSKP